MAIKDFSPSDSLFTWGGVPAQDFADGEYLRVETEDMWVDAPSAGGGGTRIRTNNKWATITVTLQNGSPTNDLWGEFINAGKALPLYFQHNNYKLVAVTAWPRKHADAMFSNSEDGSRQYVFRTEQADVAAGAA